MTYSGYRTMWRPRGTEALSVIESDDETEALDFAEKTSRREINRWVETWRLADGKPVRLVAQFKNGVAYR